MSTIRAIFDGKVFVPRGPVNLAADTVVELQYDTPESPSSAPATAKHPTRRRGMFKNDQFWMSPDFDRTPDDFKDYM